MNRTGKLTLAGIALCIALFGGIAAGCAGTPDKSAAVYKAGVYSATGQGINGSILVQVRFSDAAIIEVEIVENRETAGIGDEALAALADEIVKTQSVEVDAVSGASVSSEALLNAVAECVNKARISKTAP